MESGKLRRKITIQQETSSKDADGVPVLSWTLFATVWAAVEPISGREYFQAAAFEAENMVRVRIRYHSGITPTMRVLYGARIFDIRSVIDLEERHREIQLMCREVVAGG